MKLQSQSQTEVYKSMVAFLVMSIFALLILSACDKSSFRATRFDISTDGPSAVMSRLTVLPENVADGLTPAEIKIEIKNKTGVAISGAKMTLSVTGSQNVLVPCSVSDVTGTSHCRVYSTKAEQKWVTVTGKITLTQVTVFLQPKPNRNAFAFVSAGDVYKLPSGHKITATAGINETPTKMKDSTGTVRLHSSVLGAVLGNDD